MKKLSIITVAIGTIILASCSDGVKRKPGRVYMPDMAYSRAYEPYSVTLAEREDLDKQGIHYSNRPVDGTVKRGELLPYHLKNDSIGYVLSAGVKDPLPPLTPDEMTHAEQIYLINCGICHGQGLDGNGPLWNGGAGPFPAAPKNLLSDELKKMADGTMFHSITYGKNLMGSYASQLTRKQRWMVVQYIRSKQGPATTAPAKMPADSSAKAPATGSTAKK